MVYYKCQLCGAEVAMLEQDIKERTMVCYNRELCRATQEFNKEFELWPEVDITRKATSTNCTRAR